jgi:hypothetical protein
MTQSDRDRLLSELKGLYSDYKRTLNLVSEHGSRADMWLELIASNINRVRALLGEGPDKTLPKASDDGTYGLASGVAAWANDMRRQ